MSQWDPLEEKWDPDGLRALRSLCAHTWVIPDQGEPPLLWPV